MLVNISSIVKTCGAWPYRCASTLPSCGITGAGQPARPAYRRTHTPGRSNNGAWTVPASREEETASARISLCKFVDLASAVSCGFHVRHVRHPPIDLDPRIQVAAEEIAHGGWVSSGSRAIRSHAVPMSFASSTSRCRAASKRVSAPENKMLASNPTIQRSHRGPLMQSLLPTRRPISSRTRMPADSTTAKIIPARMAFMFKAI